MQKFRLYSLFILIAFSLTTDLNGQRLGHVLGEVIIQVKNDRGVSELMKDLSSDSHLRSSLEARQLMSEPMNLWVVKCNPNEINENHFLEKIMLHSEVLLAQKNHISQLRTIPNDPLFNNQWQYINTSQNGGVFGADIDMDLAWDKTTGGLTTDGDTIVVCIIDEGFNTDHPDFGDNVWFNHQEIPDNEIDDDGNGYIDDFQGWSAYTDNDNINVGGGHGTPVAGIVGAKGNNDVGVAGVNWDVKLMLVRGGGPESTALAAYAYPYTMRKLYNETNGEKGAFVVASNASWGVDFAFPEDAPIWCDFYNMLGEVGILNFGATINGNYDVDVVGDLPTTCESDYLVSVTNLNREDEKVAGAGFGVRSIDLGAYGAQAYTLTSSAYGGFGGTSGATPHVTGTAALLYAADCPDFTSLSKSNPALAALVIKDCILFGVTPNQSLAGITTTGGRLNTNNAIENLMSSCGDCNAAFGGNIDELTLQSGVLTWYDTGNTGNTSIRYKELDDMDWIEVENVESGFEFSGLALCSSYEYQSKTICENNPDAEYSYSKIFKTEGCCNTPSGIVISVESQIATIHWNEVQYASNYIVEWKNVMDEIWISVDLGETNTFLLDGIEECQFYEVRIKSQCAISDNESEFSANYKIDTECEGCTREFCSFGSKDVGDEWIERVEIVNVFENVSGVSANGYDTFFGEFDIELNANEAYDIILSPEHSGIQYAEYFSAYIDYNQDGEFGENESIFLSEQGTQQSVMGSFTIPFNAVNGITRMRVVMRFGEINGPCDQFGFDFGEIEDYCVNIIGLTDCPTTFETIVTDTTLTSLTFELALSDLEDTYLILYREKETQEFDTISSSSNIILVSDLQVCTTYEYKSGYICNGESVIDTEVFEAITLCEVGIAEIDILSLNVYPNPSFENVTIEFDDPAISDGTIVLSAVDGRKYSLLEKIKKGDTSVFVETYEIPSGVYMFSINFNGRIVTKKWVKY